jgi:pyridoxine 4-dehydrogenase
MQSRCKGGETVLTGVLEDSAAMFGVLAQIEALGLELLEVRHVPAKIEMNTTTFLGDKPINRMGFGAMQLAGPGVFGPPRDPVAAQAVLRRAVELGVDHIDISQYYGPDVVNDLIRQALHPYPENLKLATKVGWRRDEAGRVLPAQRPDELREGVEANLRSLRVERLDLVNLRLAGAGRDTAIPLEEQLSALEDMREEGKLDLIGLSNVDQATVRRALELVDVAGIQNGYSIIDRQDDELVDFAQEREIAFVPFFPLGSSFKGGPARLAGDVTIVRVADKHGTTPTQIALAWLLARYDRMLLIPGTSSVAHLEENMAAAELELDDADVAALDRVRDG